MIVNKIIQNIATKFTFLSADKTINEETATHINKTNTVFQTELTLVVTVLTAKVISCPTELKLLDEEFVILYYNNI